MKRLMGERKWESGPNLAIYPIQAKAPCLRVRIIFKNMIVLNTMLISKRFTFFLLRLVLNLLLCIRKYYKIVIPRILLLSDISHISHGSFYSNVIISKSELG